MSDNNDTTKPQLDGYELLDKLGAGGYGEVWSARVPGGMTKAVKCVFGRQDESRAANELKALERMREVRHPFVVSLERVEFINGRVIVVSELADGSLRDRFRQCLSEGLPGIPREELLGYLRDAADALDYLSQQHALQHLDIKPENVLLLAGHAKVADFGLVKTIGDNTQSLVGGMTPAYAPPEVFHGRPARQSDQYSLAVLYQEMLTGQTPFDGENAAQLTLQHLHDDPNLEPLSDEDRFAVSRALSKEPEHRYESCLDFVKALRSGNSFAAEPSRTSVPLKHSPAGDELSKATEVFDEEAPVVQAPMRVSLPELATQPINQPPPEVNAEGFQPTPCLFVGIGGTAGEILRRLRQRLTDRYELSGPLPTMRMLLLDTDAKSLMAASRNAGRGAGLTPEETIALPLRRPQEYRNKSDGLLRWLGRRWLYNIPKSLQAEGLRPLGRLAMVDHARQTVQRIRRAITDTLSEESLTEAKELTGIDFKPGAIRIYLVASISGGTGSGMSLDVAYAIRTLLQKLEIADAQILGIAPSLTGRESDRGELARVNAYAWIAEHQHYCTPGVAYTGDASCGLPGHPSGVRPFDATYVVHLGDRLGDQAFDQATSSVADYLLADSVTAAQTMLDACRSEEAASEPWKGLRTFGMNRVAAADDSLCRNVQQMVINQLIEQWHGETSSGCKTDDLSSTNRVVVGAGELVGKLKLDAVSLATLCRKLVEASAASCPLLPPGVGTPVERLEQLNQQFAHVATAGEPLLGTDNPNCLSGKAVSEIVQPMAEKLSQSVSQWAASGLDLPGVRLCGAMRAVAWLRDHAESLTTEFARFAENTQKKLAEVIQQAASQPNPVTDLERRYLRLKMDLVALEGAANVAAALRGGLQLVGEQLTTLRPVLAGLRQSLQSPEPCSPAGVAEALAERETSISKLVRTVDSRLQEEWLSTQGGLGNVLLSATGQPELVQAVRRFAERITQDCLRQPLPTGTTATCTLSDWQLPLLTQQASHVYYAVGSTNPTEPPTPADAQPWCFNPQEGASHLIVEASGMSAPHAAVQIVGDRRDYVEFADRVHTRRDVEWTNLLDTLNEAQPSEAVETDSVDNPFACTMQVDLTASAGSATLNLS